MKDKIFFDKKSGKWKQYRPGDEEGFGQVIEDIYDKVVVGHCLDLWSWELPIDQYPLHRRRNKKLVPQNPTKEAQKG